MSVLISKKGIIIKLYIKKTKWKTTTLKDVAECWGNIPKKFFFVDFSEDIW